MIMTASELKDIINKPEEFIFFIKNHNKTINSNFFGGGNILFYCDESLFSDYINLGADPNSENWTKSTPLFQAGVEGSEVLIKSGAKVNIQNNNGYTPLFYSNLKKTKLLLSYGADIHILNNNKENCLFSSPFHKTKFLIESGIDINQKNLKGETALFTANYDKLKLLINSGIKIDEKNNKGETALFTKSYKKMKFLIENHADVDVKDHYGYPVLFMADARQSKLLIEAGANINALNNANRNALFCASLEKIKILLQNGIDYSHQDNEKRNFLYFIEPNAAFGILNKKEMIDIMYEKNSAGESFIFEKATSILHLYAYLKNKGNPNILNKKNENILFMYNYQDEPLHLLKQVDINWNQINNKNENVLFSLCEETMFKYALNQGVDFFQRNEDGLYCFNDKYMTNPINKLLWFSECGGDLKNFNDNGLNIFSFIINSEVLMENLLRYKASSEKLLIIFFEKEIYPENYEGVSDDIKEEFIALYTIAESEYLKKHTSNILPDIKKSNTLKKNKRI